MKSKEEIYEWLGQQDYGTCTEESGTYDMYYDVDMPKILNDFVDYVNRHPLKWRTDEPPKDGSWFIARWGISICKAYYYNEYSIWNTSTFNTYKDPDGWIPVPE